MNHTRPAPGDIVLAPMPRRRAGAARVRRPLLSVLAAIAALTLSAGAATAQTKVRVAGLRTIALTPINYAEKQGYFKQEGLDVEILTVPAGPAVASAVASGSAEIGYSASVPAIYARAQGQPFKIFTALSYETSTPEGVWTWLVASGRSGVHTVAELRGKTVAINATGGLCEIQVREYLARANVPYDDVKKIIVPFPQLQAALELGNADAACVVEPFRTNIRVSPRIQPVDLGGGALPNMPKTDKMMLDVLFVRDDWGSKNIDTLERFRRGLQHAVKDFKEKPFLYKQAIIDDFKLAPATASLMKTDLAFTDGRVDAAQITPLIDALKRNGLLKAPLTAEDMILTVK